MATYYTGGKSGRVGRGTKVEVRGIENLVAKIESMQDESDRMMATAVTAGAVMVRNNALRRVPRVTSNLARSIHPDELQMNGTVVSVEVGTDVEYARRVELGFIGPDSLGRVYHQAGKPYLQPALDDARPKIQARIVRALKAMLIAKAKGGA